MFVQSSWYGGAVTLPTSDVPAKNATCVTTPSASDAVARSVSGPGAAIAPSTDGAVSVTVGDALFAGPHWLMARPTFKRPPLIVLPASAGIGSTLLRISDFSVGVPSVQCERSSAADPDTCGVAIDVPLKES